MLIILFGAGKYYERYCKFIPEKDIVAIIDNSQDLQGKILDGHRILSPEEGIKLQYDKILILSRYANEMTEQLLRLGVSNDKIIYSFEIFNIFKGELVRKKRISIISDDLKLSGAQLALFNLSILLQKHGVEMVIYSPYGGPLQQLFESANIPVYIDNGILVKNISDIEGIGSSDLIIFNTVILYHMLIGYMGKTPIMWWIHESEISYRWVVSDRLSEICSRQIHIYAVSGVAKNTFLKRNRNYEIELLPVGIEDLHNSFEKSAHDKKILLVIGELCRLKGQDVVKNALDILLEEEKNNIELWLCGRANYDTNADFINSLLDVPNIRYLGEISKDQMDELYSQVDVLICSSRMESLSMVVIEALQRHIPVIVSSEAGICNYLNDGRDSFIYESENVQDLAQKIHYCLEGVPNIKDILDKGYKIYKKHFSEKVFEDNTMKVISKLLGETDG